MSFTCYRTKSNSSTSSSENDDDSTSKISTADEHLNIVDIKEGKNAESSDLPIHSVAQDEMSEGDDCSSNSSESMDRKPKRMKNVLVDKYGIDGNKSSFVQISREEKTRVKELKKWRQYGQTIKKSNFPMEPQPWSLLPGFATTQLPHQKQSEQLSRAMVTFPRPRHAASETIDMKWIQSYKKRRFEYH
jgi:hypothetical protein